MRTRDATWQALALQGDFDVETKAIINNVEYTTISAPTLSGGTLSGSSISVGNCISTTLSFMVKTNNEIPRAAQVEIKCRLSDGIENGQRSQWMTMGTFWVNQRTVNDDWVTLECYDAMMAGNQPYVDNSQSLNWPKAMSTVVARICVQMGVTLDARTTINSGADYQCTKPNDDDTLLDILQWIAEVHGGNWVITPENKLRLVPLVPPPPETYNIIDYSYNRIQTDDGYNLVWKHRQTQEVITNPAGGELINVPVVIGGITTATRYAISKITMTIEETEQGVTAYVAGDDSGYNLIIDYNPYATQAICNALLTQLNGLAYAPYDVKGACFDPCAEYGDWIIVADKVSSVLYNITQTYGQSYRADISAPGEDEVEAEYPYQTPTQKMRHEISALNADGAVIKSEIVQMQDSITLTISELDDKADKAQIRSQFALDSTSVTIQTGEIAFTSDSISISSQYFTLAADGTLTCTGATINGSLRTVYDVGYGTITVTDLKYGALTLLAAPYSASIHNNYDNIYSASDRAQIELFLNSSPGYHGTDKYSGITAGNGTTLVLESTNSSNKAAITMGTTYVSDYGYSSWMGITSKGLINIISDGRLNLNSPIVDIAASGSNGQIILNASGGKVVLYGDIYTDNVSSGYKGITGMYWTGNSNANPILLNFRNGLCVGVSS